MAKDNEAGHRQMSTSKQPAEPDAILEFLMGWLLSFGTGWSTGFTTDMDWYWNSPETATRQTIHHPPLIERDHSNDCWRITQAGLDYIKNGHGQMSESRHQQSWVTSITKEN